MIIDPVHCFQSAEILAQIQITYVLVKPTTTFSVQASQVHAINLSQNLTTNYFDISYDNGILHHAEFPHSACLSYIIVKALSFSSL